MSFIKAALTESTFLHKDENCSSSLLLFLAPSLVLSSLTPKHNVKQVDRDPGGQNFWATVIGPRLGHVTQTNHSGANYLICPAEARREKPQVEA